MNLQTAPPRLHPDLSELTRRTLADLEDEAATLDATLEGLRRFRNVLLRGDSAGLAAALERQEASAQARAAQAVRRERLRHDWAAILGISPEDVTLTVIAGQLSGDDGARFGRLHARVQALAAEAEELNRGNAAVAGQCLDFLYGFLVELTGGPNSPRYSPAGTQLGAACGSLIEARG